MFFFRKHRLPLDLVAICPGGRPPTTADQHRCVAMRQLTLAGDHPAVTGDYLAAAQVHLLAALLAQHEEAAAERQRLADRSIQNLLTGMHDLLNPPSSAHVRIFHNLREPDLLSTYTDSDPLVEVFTYVQNDVTPGTHDHVIAGDALTLFCSSASHDMPDERGEHYRRRGNRALRDGDVVAVDGRFYLSTSFGWDPVLSPNLVGTGRPDSIPLRGVPEAT